MSTSLPIIPIHIFFKVSANNFFENTIMWDHTKTILTTPEAYAIEMETKFDVPTKSLRAMVMSIQQQLVLHLSINPSLYDIPVGKCEDMSSFFHISQEMLDLPYTFDMNNYEQIHINECMDNKPVCNYCKTSKTSTKICTYCCLPNDPTTFFSNFSLYQNSCQICGRSDGKFVYCNFCCLKYHKQCLNCSHVIIKCPYCEIGCKYLKDKPQTTSNILLYILYRMTLFQDHDIFTFDIDESIKEEYYEEMKYPIYLQLVVARLIGGKYHRISEILMDVRQIYRNCRVYNSEDSDIFKSSLKYQRIFESMVWQWVFQIRQLPSF